MMYKHKFAVSVKNNGKILRDSDGEVRLPFGSDYSIYLKNLNTVDAVVKVSIDGTDVLDGNSLVLNPNSILDLKGFMKRSKVTNRFRFIEKTKEISDYRGDRVDDGLIRVEFRFVKKQPNFLIVDNTSPWIKNYVHDTKWSDSVYGPDYGYPVITCYSCNSNSCNYINEDGITVKGAETTQDFTHTYVNNLEEHSEVIVLRLVGASFSGKAVRKPITTKTKITCTTCGRKWKSYIKYCGNCSTYLR